MPTATLEKILYIEDEPDIQTIAKIALEAVDSFTVDVYNSGSEAVNHALELRPDLILLDVMMPGMDGPTTMQELRKFPHLAEVPVIFMTAKVRAHEVARYRDLGALGVVTKPFDPMTLAQNIREIWNKEPQHHP